MPGTDPVPPPESTPPHSSTLTSSEFVNRLTLVGWLLLGGQIGFVLFQFERARSVDGTRFATAWDQRVEVLSFVMLPPNMVVLVPAAAVACLATWLAGARREPWLTTLLAVVVGVAVTLFFVGVAAIVEIINRPGQGSELDSIFLRLGGMSLAAGITVMCRVVDTSSR